MQNAIDAFMGDGGWARPGSVASNVAKQAPEFDPRNYGYRKLRDFVEAMKLFEIREDSAGPGHPKVICIRDQRRK